MTRTLDMTSQAAVARMQRDYEAALPRILRHARVKLRSIRDPGGKDDALQDVVGIGWQHFLHCVEAGKDPNQFISTIAEYAVRQVKSGRHVTSQDRANDVLSPSAQRRRSFTVQALPDRMDTGEDDNRTIDALADTRQASPADQAAFRIDVSDWLDSLGAKRAIVEEMAAGEGTMDLAERFKKSPGRVSQIRTEAAESYRKFHGEGRQR
jgi:DNA-directed RNA polymerase specialized sigma24 family protein